MQIQIGLTHSLLAFQMRNTSPRVAYDKWLRQVITQIGLLTSTRLHNSRKMPLVGETSCFLVCEQ